MTLHPTTPFSREGHLMDGKAYPFSEFVTQVLPKINQLDVAQIGQSQLEYLIPLGVNPKLFIQPDTQQQEIFPVADEYFYPSYYEGELPAPESVILTFLWKTADNQLVVLDKANNYRSVSKEQLFQLLDAVKLDFLVATLRDDKTDLNFLIDATKRRAAYERQAARPNKIHFAEEEEEDEEL